jgi:transposase
LLRDLLAGGAPTDLSATTAAALLRRVRPSGDAERVRKQIATDLVSQIRSVDSLLKANAKQISELVAASGSTLTSTVGIGAITAGRLIGRTDRAARFASSAAFATYAGVAPVEIASADKARHRLSRSGDRQLNAALHTVAITQIRTRQPRSHLLHRQTRRG